MVVICTTIVFMKVKKEQRKTTPMQVRVDGTFKDEIRAVAEKLQISSCDLVRLSVATQLRKLRSGQIEISDLAEA